jgi:fatty-acyl-CoA synthase
VVGLADQRWGEAPHAFIVFRPGMSATPEDLTAFAREHMAHFKVPKGWHPVDELPKTATGKIQKFVLRGGATAVARQ